MTSIRCRARLLALLPLLAAAGCHHAPPPQPPPTLPANSVGHPLFAMRGQKAFGAGSSFVARLDDGAVVMLSALHLFGEAGGLDSEIPASQIPDRVAGAVFVNMDGSEELAVTGPGLLRQGFPVGSQGDDLSGDIVAFAVRKGNPGALALAPANPAPDTRVWLAAKEYGVPGATPTLYPCVVKSSSDTIIVVEPDSPVKVMGMSGAPCVDAQGRVVGIILASNKNRITGSEHVLLNPVSSIRSHLAAVSLR